MINNSVKTFILVFTLIIFSGLSALASPPHPDLLKDAESGQKILPYYITHLDEMHAKGISTGENVYEQAITKVKNVLGKNALAVGDFNVLAVLVRFSDHSSTTPSVYFDSLMFDTAGITVRDYYDDISYGQVDLVTLDLPSSLGWITAPQTYDYYVNNENGTGSYPQNCQKMVEDIVDLIDPSVDFSVYDNDNNGFVDVMVVIHSGQGAEYTSDSTDVWSHSWGIIPRMTGEGVYVSSYTIQPEYLVTPGDMTIGVFAHELGHAFGLPDLYDTDYSSAGIGKYGIMSFGSWLGPGNNGGMPAQPSAWSRIELGFASPVTVSTNIDSQAIQDVKTSGEIYRLWTSGSVGNEYFLVENRQKTGYDQYLPGDGLFIWHIDEGNSDNDSEWYPGLDSTQHFLVALEQSDGLFELEHYTDLGDSRDAFPGLNNVTDFNAVSSVTSDSYTDGVSFVGVENISASGSTMTADLKVAFASGVEDDNTQDEDNETVPETMELSQNYPNPFNPSTMIEFNTVAGGHAILDIYNISGQRVRHLLDADVTSGVTAIEWDGLTDEGTEVSSGIYLYRLTVGQQEQIKKMVLVR